MKGKCTNLDENCPNFNKIIEVPDDEDFICPKCGHPLYEVEGHESGKKKTVTTIVIGSVVVIVIIAISLFLIIKSGEDAGNVMVTGMEQESKVFAGDTLHNNDNGIVDTSKIVSDSIKKDDITSPAVIEKIVYLLKDTSDVDIKYQFGYYKGDVMGQEDSFYFPHGSGIMYFTDRMLVPSRDPDLYCIAEIGDFIKGEWRYGAIVTGNLYNVDGNLRRSLNPGVSPNKEPLNLNVIYKQFLESQKKKL